MFILVYLTSRYECHGCKGKAEPQATWIKITSNKGWKIYQIFLWGAFTYFFTSFTHHLHIYSHSVSNRSSKLKGAVALGILEGYKLQPFSPGKKNVLSPETPLPYFLCIESFSSFFLLHNRWPEFSLGIKFYIWAFPSNLSSARIPSLRKRDLPAFLFF